MSPKSHWKWEKNSFLYIFFKEWEIRTNKYFLLEEHEILQKMKWCNILLSMIIIEFSTIFQILFLGVVGMKIFSQWYVRLGKLHNQKFRLMTFLPRKFRAGNFSTGNSVAWHISRVKFRRRKFHRRKLRRMALYPHYIWRMIFSPRPISPLGISSTDILPQIFLSR